MAPAPVPPQWQHTQAAPFAASPFLQTANRRNRKPLLTAILVFAVVALLGAGVAVAVLNTSRSGDAASDSGVTVVGSPSWSSDAAGLERDPSGPTMPSLAHAPTEAKWVFLPPGAKPSTAFVQVTDEFVVIADWGPARTTGRCCTSSTPRPARASATSDSPE